MNYISLFSEAAQKNRERIAVAASSSAGAVSYAELDRLSSLAAGKLHALGCAEGDFVAVLLNRSAEYIAAYLGALKAGCAVVPLTQAYPQERTDYITADCGAKLVITKDFFNDIDRYGEFFAPAADDSPALVVYTSGSSGNPKGVCHTVSGICAAALRQKSELFKGCENCKSSVVAPFSFVANFVEVYVSLLCGNTLYLVPEETLRSSKLITGFLEQNQIEFSYIPIQLLRFIDETRLHFMKLIWTGGEALSGISFSKLVLLNVYGQSETVCAVTRFKVDRRYEMTPIGKLYAGLTAHVLDEDSSPVPDGTVGELCIEGNFGVSYLNDPEKTAKTFAVLENGNMLIHTGDRVFINENGDIVYVSRKDWMVKINGQRVETMEVERKLNAVCGIANSAVRAWTDSNRQTYIAGYYEADGDITDGKIRAELEKTLPDYMIPRFLIRMDALPKNSNGKLDRKSLPEPDLDSYRAEYKAPANETEKLICEGFAAALNCGKTGANDDFIALGGDSVKVLKLLDAVNIPSLTANTILSGRTPAGIAALLDASAGTAIAHSETIPDICPMTEAQLGVYMECLESPESLKYNLPFVIRLSEDTDIDKYIAAVRAVAEAHPAFCVTAEIADGVPCMRYRKKEIAVGIKEAASLEAEIAGFVRPFDLENGPLCRFEVCRYENKTAFLFDIHHLIFDGSSFKVFVNQIEKAYEGGKIPPEKLDLFDISKYEKDMKTGETYRKAQEFFASEFNGVELQSIPHSDLISGEKPEGFGSSDEYSGGLFDSTRVNRFAKAHGITENTVFLGAFAYALKVFAGTEDIFFTTVNSGRHDSRLAESIGMFVKTLPLHFSVNDNDDVASFLTRVQSDFFKTMEHDCISFGELVSAYGIKTDVSFVYQSDMSDGAEAINTGAAVFPVDVMMFREGDNYRSSFRYDRSRYTDAFIDSLNKTYMQIISELLSCEKLSDICLISDGQKELLDGFNRTETAYDSGKTVVDMFRDRASLSPDSTAVVYLDRTYTYRDTDRISDSIASYLIKCGIGRGDVVSVLIKRSEYMPIASLGVLKAGAAYQPLDPSYPEDRLSFMTKDASAKLLIADEDLIERLPDWNGKTLFTKDIPSLPDASCEEKAALSAASPKPEDLFILLYTSGSTGTPKGVRLLHKNIAAFCHQHIARLEITKDSVVAAYASYGFDANLMDTYPTLTSGAKLVIVCEDIRLDLSAINKYYIEQRVTHAFMTTQVGRQLVLTTDSPYLKFIYVGGEALVPVVPKDGIRLLNIYGPTECTVYVTSFDVSKPYRRVPIGGSVDNVKLYVVDGAMRRLPIGVPGELCIAGHQVSEGYLNRPEKTAEVYLENPFDNEPGYERIYRTGDTVRMLPGGIVDFIGRNDGQVKIRGFRIELTEVEEIIRRFPGIKDATVTAFETPTGGKELAAYVVSDEKVDTGALNSFIRGEKPPYMVPAVTMQIDRIPLNQNQKVNKKALPKPELGASETAQTENKGALTELEKRILAVLSETTGISTADVTTALVGLGVSSISAISFATVLEKKFGVNIPVAKLLQGLSVMDIENEITLSLLDKKEETKASAKTHEQQSEYPLTQTQLGIYYETMQHPDDTLYNVPFCLKFTGIDGEKLRDAVLTAVKAHTYLNTYVKTGKNGFLQVRNDNAEINVSMSEAGERDIKSIFRGFVRPFNLHAGPLYRFEIVNSGNKLYLMMDFHHIVFDGFSVNLFMDSVKQAYETGRADAEEYTYFDYSLDEEAFRQSDEYSRSEEYFKNLLSDFENTTEIPADISGKAEDGRAASVTELIDGNAVESFCKNNRITPSTLFLSSVFYTVSRFASANDVYISTISNGRASAKTREAVGMFVRTLPVVMRPGDSMTVADYIKAAEDAMNGSIANELYPFTEIAAKYGYTTDVMYECQLGVLSEIEVGGHTAEDVPIDNDTLKFKLKIAVFDSDDGIRLAIEYNNALYSEKYMRLLARSLKICTERMMADTSAAVKHLSLLSDEDEKRLEAFSKTELGPVPGEGLIHHMFEAQAAARPDTTAIIACDGSMSYKELDRQANIIANNLIAKGVGKGDMIVLLLPRRSFYFAAVLGVLKAGAAFIPCDPQYPADRIRLITEDSGAQYVVTTADKTAQYAEGCAIDITELLCGEDASAPQSDVTCEDLAYAIYTSGSTGKPKGVLIRHIGVCSYFANADANILYKNADSLHVENVLCITTVSFDMSMKDGLGMLCNGKTLVFADEDQMNDPMAIAGLMEKYDIELFSSTPSRLLQYLDYKPFAEQLKKQKIIICGAEMYPLSLKNTLQQMTNAMLFNSYGPTEITISSNMADLTNADHVSVGKPIYNYVEFIVDTDGNLLPAGVIGELYVGGPGVARGYRNLEELTQKNFIDYNGIRVYKTGDYARWDDEGNVLILGRKDNQVKLRGLRIELGEIESLIAQQPSVKQALVLIKKLNGQDTLCAYYTATEKLDPIKLRDALKTKLTHYMVPTAYLQLEVFPVNANGKTDRKALPEPVPVRAGDFVEASGETERFFCDVFAKTLKMDKVGAEDDFFESGGSSLSVTSIVVAAVENGYQLSYSDVFSHTTPRALAALVTGEKTENRDNETEDFDYTAINELLSKNTLDSFRSGESRELGNILLTGATGYMGIHVLFHLLKYETGKIYCLLRRGKFESPKQRLKSVLFYYFGDEVSEAFESRAEVLEGDVTSYDNFAQFEKYDIQTLFNCAANVKHFSTGTDIEDVNIGGAENCITFCRKKNARLIHFSTTSTAGEFIAKAGQTVPLYNEQTLYMGQVLNNKYAHSKFIAERKVLTAVTEGLDAKVIRVGTLAPRNSDGEFQINYLTNNFMGRLRTYALVGVFPYSLCQNVIRMGAIDVSVASFMKLARTPSACCVFNACNNHTIFLSDIIVSLRQRGKNIRFAEYEEFHAELMKAAEDPAKAAILSSLLAYVNAEQDSELVPVEMDCTYTNEILSRMDFMWNITDKEYLDRFLTAMDGLRFFNDANLLR